MNVNDAPKSQQDTVTLEPIRTTGPAALDTSGDPHIKKATLRELTIAWDDPGHHTITLKADDLLTPSAPSETPPPPIPSDGELASATVELQLDNDPRPHLVQILPPATVRPQYTKDIQLILSWLARIHLRIIAGSTTILLLLAAAAAPPTGFDDSDDDPDDTQSDHTILTP